MIGGQYDQQQGGGNRALNSLSGAERISRTENGDLWILFGCSVGLIFVVAFGLQMIFLSNIPMIIWVIASGTIVETFLFFHFFPNTVSSRKTAVLKRPRKETDKSWRRARGTEEGPSIIQRGSEVVRRARKRTGEFFLKGRKTSA